MSKVKMFVSISKKEDAIVVMTVDLVTVMVETVVAKVKMFVVNIVIQVHVDLVMNVDLVMETMVKVAVNVQQRKEKLVLALRNHRVYVTHINVENVIAVIPVIFHTILL